MDAKVKHIVGPTIALRSGAYFDFEDPHSSDFTIDDIAHGLAHICRFTGQCRQFYSVAEHSVHASRIVAPELAFEALMHDAPEAFIGDIAKPLKMLLPSYRRIEDLAERAVFQRYGLTSPLSPAVKEADRKMLRAEQAQAMRNDDHWPAYSNTDAAPITLRFWAPGAAKAMFLARFRELAGIQTP